VEWITSWKAFIRKIGLQRTMHFKEKLQDEAVNSRMEEEDTSRTENESQTG
jgi:hypothetical protein